MVMISVSWSFRFGRFGGFGALELVDGNIQVVDGKWGESWRPSAPVIPFQEV